MKMRRNHSKTPDSPTILSRRPDSSPSPKKRKRVRQAIEWKFDPPRPLNLKCTEGLVCGPLWTLWTVWIPESPLSVTIQNPGNRHIQLKNEYLKLFYDTLRLYNTEFTLTDEEATTVHIIDTIGAPAVHGGKHIYPVNMKNFHGCHANLGKWKLEVWGDLAEILSSALGSFEEGQVLLIIGASTNFMRHTITLNGRLESRQKAHIVHYVNKQSWPADDDYYRPYGALIETANIQMVYFATRAQPGRVLKMTPYVGASLGVTTCFPRNEEPAAAQVVPLQTNRNDSENSPDPQPSCNGSIDHSRASCGQEQNILNRSGSDGENLQLTPVRRRTHPVPETSPTSIDSGKLLQQHQKPTRPSHRTDPKTLQDPSPAVHPQPNSENSPDQHRLAQNEHTPRNHVREQKSATNSRTRQETSSPANSAVAEHSPDQPRTSRSLNRNHHDARTRMEKKPKGEKYMYKTLTECRRELTDKGTGPEEYRTLFKHTNMYGVVQEIIPTNVPDSYEIRIYDETREGVPVRIHANPTNAVLGPKIKLNDIIRIHRGTIQEELTGQTREMVISTSPHHNYILFNYDPDDVSGEILGRTSAKAPTRHAYDRRRVLELRQLITVREQQLLGTQSPPDTKGPSGRFIAHD